MKGKNRILLLVASFLILIHPSGSAQDTIRWVRTGGPPGGLGYDIRYNYDFPDIWYVTDANGGVHRSIDNGYNWVPVNNGISTFSGPTNDNVPAFCLSVNPHNPMIIWAGTQNSGHLYKSVDLGLNWVESDHGISIEHDALAFRGITFDPLSPEVIYAMGETTSEALGGPYVWGKGTGGVIYKTSDGGDNWEKIWDGGIPSSLTRYMWINPRNTNILYVSTGIFDRGAIGEGDMITDPFGGIGILKSTDAGQTWTVQNESNGLRSLYLGSLYMHPLNPDTLLACAGHVLTDGRGTVYLENLIGSGGKSPFGIYKTTNGGQDWTQVYDPADNIGEVFSSVEFSIYDPSIAYAASGTGIYKSEDEGDTWQRVSNGGDNWGPKGVDPGFPIDIQCDPRNPNRLFINNYGGGNFLSEDGGQSWVNASNGYTGAKVRKVAVSPKDPALVYTVGSSGIWFSRDAGLSWEGLHYSPENMNLPGDYASVLPDKNDRNHLISGTIGGSILESYDGGFQWHFRWPGFNQFGEPLPGGGEISDLVFAPSNSQKLYAGISVPGCSLSPEACQEGKGLIYSKDGGTSWAISPDPLIKDLAVIALAVDPSDDQRVYAGTENGLFLSDDGALSWTKVNTLPVSDRIRAVAIHPENPQVIFVALDGFGIYLSEDNALTWTALVAGLEPNSSIRKIIFNPNDAETIYTCDLLSGVYLSEDGGEHGLKKMRASLIVRLLIYRFLPMVNICMPQLPGTEYIVLI